MARKCIAVLLLSAISGGAIAAQAATFLPEPDRKSPPITLAKIVLAALAKPDRAPVFVRLDEKQVAAVREVTNSQNAGFGFAMVQRWFAEEGCGRVEMAMAQEVLG